MGLIHNLNFCSATWLSLKDEFILKLLFNVTAQ